jgi:tetratricopeptide (TPR) repeat protein
MYSQSLVASATHPQAVKVFWETIGLPTRIEMLKRLYASRELISKRSKTHHLDELLVRLLKWQTKAVQRKEETWRIERILSYAEAHPQIIHDVCHAYLKTYYQYLIDTLKTIGDNGQPTPQNTQFPAEWYLRVVDHLTYEAPAPIAAMCMFTLFSECDGRNEAFADARYQFLWEQHVAWSTEHQGAQSDGLPEITVAFVAPQPPALGVEPTPASPVQPPRPVPAPRAVPRRVIPTPDPIPESPVSLGPLDRLMLRAINESSSATLGALSDTDIQLALKELLALNSGNDKYYYHVGYYLGLHGLPFRVEKQQTRVAQSWSFLGYLLGMWRDIGAEMAEVFVNYKRNWEQMLTDLDVRDLVVCYQFVPMMLQRERSGPAVVAELVTHCPIPHIKSADHPESMPQHVYAVAANLVRGGEHLNHADSILHTLIEQLEGNQQQFNLYGKCLRKRGQLLRRRRNFAQAQEMFMQAIEVPEFTEVAQTHADIGLTMAGFQALDAIVPDSSHDFRVIQQSLLPHEAHFRSALQVPNGDYTNAQFVLGILAFANGNLPEAYAFFSESKRGMERQLAAYKVRSLYDWTVFLKIRAGSQSLETSDIPTLRDELQVVSTSQTFFPLPHWLKIFHNVGKVHPATARDVMLHLFRYRNLDIYDVCDISELFQQPRDIWQRYFFGDKFIRLGRAEKLDRYRDAFQYALSNDNDEASEYVLSLLEQHANDYSEHAPLIDQIITEYYDHVLRIWEEADVLHLRIQLQWMMGKPDIAVVLIEQLTNIYLGQRDFAQARATYAWLKQVDTARATQYAEILEVPTASQHTTRCRVLYVGGNETQQSFKDEITVRLRAEHPYIEVTWELIGWRSNWDRDAERIEKVIPEYDLVILSPYVRTLFGRHIRRASQHWRSSTGKGQGRIYHDIVAAVQSFQAE